MRVLVEVAKLFLKLGTIGFGGPAAHIAVMDREVVQRRGWLAREQFLDLVGVGNLLPGPIATKLACAVGYRRAGFAGLIVAGGCFVLPAALITAGIAWAYVKYGSLPEVDPFLRGINPVVLAIVLSALGQLGQKALAGWQLLVIGAGVATWQMGVTGGTISGRLVLGTLAIAVGDPAVTLVVATVLGVLLLWLTRARERSLDSTSAGAIAVVPAFGSGPIAWSAAAPATALGVAGLSAVSLGTIFVFFLKVGTVLFGGGYVLIAYLWPLVQDYGWLEEKQLVDAIAVGQFTPGPILTTATFVGYVIAGFPGSAVATAGIFVPSFLLTALVVPWIPQLRRLRWAGLFLDAVNAASLGLMAAATLMLARGSLVDWRGWLLWIVAMALALRGKIAPAWLVLGGAVAGWGLSHC